MSIDPSYAPIAGLIDKISTIVSEDEKVLSARKTKWPAYHQDTRTKLKEVDAEIQSLIASDTVATYASKLERVHTCIETFVKSDELLEKVFYERKGKPEIRGESAEGERVTQIYNDRFRDLKGVSLNMLLIRPRPQSAQSLLSAITKDEESHEKTTDDLESHEKITEPFEQSLAEWNLEEEIPVIPDNTNPLPPKKKGDEPDNKQISK